MVNLPVEYGVMVALAINALVFAAAGWMVWRRGGTAGNAILLYLGVQYVAVGIPGAIGRLDGISMSAVALVAAMGMVAVGIKGNNVARPQRPRGNAIGWAGVGFAAGVVGAWCYFMFYFPSTAEDAITYHVPAAAEWMRTGRIAIWPTWFFNPANAYSPLAGSVFEAWWMGWVKGDLLARFAQAPAIALIISSVIGVGRKLGIRWSGAVWVGVACAVCRPLLAEAAWGMDDLFLAAFFIAAIDGLLEGKAWKLGLALGLMLATKYTALLVLPIFLLGIDHLVRRGWKWEWLLVIGLAAALAGPWYARNWVVTGNPVFPVSALGFKGMFITERSLKLRSWAGMWQILHQTTAQFYLPIGVMAVMGIGWCGALVAWMRGGRDVALRLCVWGPMLGIAIFVAVSPYGELRFLFPEVLLLLACGGAGVWKKGQPWAQILIAAVCAGTMTVPAMVGMLVVAGLLGAAGVSALAAMRGKPGVQWGMAVVVGLVLWGWVYVDGRAAARDYAATRWEIWSHFHGPELTALWHDVDELCPADGTVAYSNTHLVWPLMGQDGRRRVIYVPTHAGIQRMDQMPSFDKPVSGEEIVGVFSRELRANVDGPQWERSIRESGADYLLVVKDSRWWTGWAAGPSEIWLAGARPGMFQRVMENGKGVLFRVGRVK